MSEKKQMGGGGAGMRWRTVALGQQLLSHSNILTCPKVEVDPIEEEHEGGRL